MKKMSKTRMAKLFVKRLLRSNACWVIIITIIFCIANYSLLRKMEIERQNEYLNEDKIITGEQFHNFENTLHKEFVPVNSYFKDNRDDGNNLNNFKKPPIQNTDYKDDSDDPDDSDTSTPTRPPSDNQNVIPKTTYYKEEKIPLGKMEFEKTTVQNILQEDEMVLPNINVEKSLPGDMGLPFYVPDNMKEEMDRRFSEYQLNIVATEMIPLNRSLPDYRYHDCKQKIYPNELPSASIIIVFRNEAWSTLLRTVWSVINRTPRKFLEEIILVDDASEFENLGQPLDDYVKTIEIVPVKILRIKERVGLIKGRLYGIEISTGTVIIFLDAHCECTEGWIEPLLARVAEDPRAVVSPQIDVIDDTDFGYQTVYEQLGGFDWILDFKWISVPDRELARIGNDKTKPIRTPLLAGGLVAINKQFFNDIGAYDDEMNIWGAENFEMAFRIWQCGGSLELVPCSRVGHVFRKTTPHSFPEGERKTIFTNKARVAEVWMDKWKDIFFGLNPDIDPGNVTKRVELRKRLECKSFEWYLKNIYPESNFPIEYNHLGAIRNLETKKCIDSIGRDMLTNIQFNTCSRFEPFQIFTYTENNNIQSDLVCLTVSSEDENKVILQMCKNDKDNNNNWFYDDDNKNFINLKTGKCLMQPDNYRLEVSAILTECDKNSIRQKWELVPVNEMEIN